MSVRSGRERRGEVEILSVLHRDATDERAGRVTDNSASTPKASHSSEHESPLPITRGAKQLRRIQLQSDPLVHLVSPIDVYHFSRDSTADHLGDLVGLAGL